MPTAQRKQEFLDSASTVVVPLAVHNNARIKELQVLGLRPAELSNYSLIGSGSCVTFWPARAIALANPETLPNFNESWH